MSRHHTPMLLVDFRRFQNVNSSPIGSVYIPVPNQHYRNKVLKVCEFPNFEEFIYVLKDSLPEEILKKLPKKKFFTLTRRYVDTHLFDSKGRRVYGTKKEPYKFFFGETGAIRNSELGHIPYTCYRANGSVITDSFERIIREIPEDASEYTVILVYKFTNDDPISNKWAYRTIVTSLKTLIEKEKEAC